MIFFYVLKIIFDISTSKQFKMNKPYQILTKKKKEILNFLPKRFQPLSRLSSSCWFSRRGRTTSFDLIYVSSLMVLKKTIIFFKK